MFYGSIGDEWLTPWPLIYEDEMTAIAIIYTTPGGFILAADGRVTHPETLEIRSDEEQKVIQVKCAECKLAYTVMGSVIDGKSFDLRTEIDQHTQALCASGINSFDEYCRLLRESVTPAIVRGFEGEKLESPSTEHKFKVTAHLAGYYKNRAVWAQFEFFSENDIIRSTHNHLNLCNGKHFMCGSRKVPELAQNGDSRFAKYKFHLTQKLEYTTIGGAADYAKAFVDVCSDPLAKDIDPICKIIGGHFHMLQITRGKMEWLYRPKEKGDSA